MPTYRIVVVDAKKYNAWQREMYARIGVVWEKSRELPAGHVHSIVASECPQGKPNCRSCGDPDAIEHNADHCQQCGVDHGIAPNRVLREHGLVLELEA